MKKFILIAFVAMSFGCAAPPKVNQLTQGIYLITMYGNTFSDNEGASNSIVKKATDLCGNKDFEIYISEHDAKGSSFLFYLPGAGILYIPEKKIEGLQARVTCKNSVDKSKKANKPSQSDS